MVRASEWKFSVRLSDRVTDEQRLQTSRLSYFADGTPSVLRVAEHASDFARAQLKGSPARTLVLLANDRVVAALHHRGDWLEWVAASPTVQARAARRAFTAQFGHSVAEELHLHALHSLGLSGPGGFRTTHLKPSGVRLANKMLTHLREGGAAFEPDPIARPKERLIVHWVHPGNLRKPALPLSD